ncbi:MAG: hypothetical protein IPL15_07030 [Comamonadaceae bacterium]|uniref:hypothetical protein n=1 Tax=Candidatus Skiveiella danica TaxID=3386177 RepID=UPI00390934B0|nr:hypothetical protein [Comamonadaceae bacterium]
MRDAILIGADGGGDRQLLADFLRREFFDLDPGGFDRFGAELQGFPSPCSAGFARLFRRCAAGCRRLVRPAPLPSQSVPTRACRSPRRQRGRHADGQGDDQIHFRCLHGFSSDMFVRRAADGPFAAFHFVPVQPALCSSSLRVKA